MSLLFNMPSRFVIAFLLRSKHLLISLLQSLSIVILESKKIKSVTASTFSPSNKWLLIIIVFVLNDLVKGQGGRRGNRKEKILLPFYFSFQICPVCISAYRDMPWPGYFLSFPGSSDTKVSAYKAGDSGSIPGSGRSAGEGNGNPLQYSCLENSMDRGAW